jgi:hypothetical protein
VGRLGGGPFPFSRKGETMSKSEKYATLTRALTVALLRLDVGTAVFEPSELAMSQEYSLRCRCQADGSVAVILDQAS